MRTQDVTRHYWNNEGGYEKELNNLTKKHMPASGRAETLVGELIRIANRLYYEYLNNGNINAGQLIETERDLSHLCPHCGGIGYIETDDGEYDCPYCGGEGYDIEEEKVISPFYDNMLRLLRETLTSSEQHKVIDAVEEIILSDGYINDGYFSDENIHKYDVLIDYIVEYAMQNHNSLGKIPDWYSN